MFDPMFSEQSQRQVLSLFMKATVLREITVPAYTRHDGVVVPSHRKMVHIDPDRSVTDVVNGQGSHSQRAAHRRLSNVPGFHAKDELDRYHHILSHATSLQRRASQSAALSGWRAAARAGRNPSASQWAAFNSLDADKQAAEMAQVETAAGGSSHLVNPSPPVADPVAITDPVPADGSDQVAMAPETATLPAASAPEPREPQDGDEPAGQAAPVPAVAVVSPLATPAVDHAAVMAAVPVPDMSHLSESATNAGTRRRMAQLAAVAAAGDYDAVVNFTTSRSRANYALVADYRDALIDRVSRAGTTAQHVASAIAQPVPPAPVIDEPPAAAASPAAGAAPAAPTITGSNPNNSALIAAQARVRALERASLAADPVPAILAVTTTRHNYMRQADDYRTALLAHFGHSAGGGELVGSAEVAAAPTAAMARRRRSPAPTPAAAPSASTPVPPSQNPLIAANPHGASEAELGFVPRPNVPLTMRTTSLPPGYRWPHPEMEELNRRYLAQSTTLQTRARDYQAGTWVPDTPQVRAARLEQARLQAERDRAALAEIERRRASIPDVFRPINTPGNNVTGVTVSSGALEAARAICGINSQVELELFAKTIVADFGADETFSIQVGGMANSFDVILRGSNGTQIKRTFRKTATGASVYHAFFEAGRTGGGSGRHLFRTSMGLYQQYGIKEVTVTANIDVGGYAWARFGYKASNWPSLQRELKSRLDTLSRGALSVQVRDASGSRRHERVPALTPEQVRKVQQVLDNPDGRTVWAIADMKVGGRSVGKELLLGTSWSGVIPLGDASAMARFTNYVTPRS